MRKNFWVDKGKWIAVDGALKRKKRVLSLLMFKALKWNMFRITAYKDVIFMRQFHPSATNRYQSISIYLLIVIENRYQSITTQIIISHRWVIDYPYQVINWYRLVLIIKFIDWIPWDSTTHDIICAKNTRWLQSAGICNETNAQKRSCWLCNVWPDWCTSHQSHYFLLYNGIPEFMRKPLMLTVK